MISVVITGRRIQASEIPIPVACLSSAARFFAFADRDTGSIGQLQVTVGDHNIAVGDAALKHGDVSERARDLDGPQFGDLVLDGVSQGDASNTVADSPSKSTAVAVPTAASPAPKIDTTPPGAIPGAKLAPLTTPSAAKPVACGLNTRFNLLRVS